MKLAFPAQWTEEITTSLPPREAETRIQNAAVVLHWQQISKTDRKLQFRVGMNWKSSGEIITVDWQPDRILIHSKCRLVTQCFDWGKNKENCLLLACRALIASTDGGKTSG